MEGPAWCIRLMFERCFVFRLENLLAHAWHDSEDCLSVGNKRVVVKSRVDVASNRHGDGLGDRYVA